MSSEHLCPARTRVRSGSPRGRYEHGQSVVLGPVQRGRHGRGRVQRAYRAWAVGGHVLLHLLGLLLLFYEGGERAVMGLAA